LKPKTHAFAYFQKNMVETLNEYFDIYSVDGMVTVEVKDHGLWLVNPDGSKQILGATERLPSNRANAH